MTAMSTMCIRFSRCSFDSRLALQIPFRRCKLAPSNVRPVSDLGAIATATDGMTTEHLPFRTRHGDRGALTVGDNAGGLFTKNFGLMLPQMLTPIPIVDVLPHQY